MASLEPLYCYPNVSKCISLSMELLCQSTWPDALGIFSGETVEMKTKSKLIEETQQSLLGNIFLYKAIKYPDCYQFPVLAPVLSVILLRICPYQTYRVGQIILHLLGD